MVLIFWFLVVGGGPLVATSPRLRPLAILRAVGSRPQLLRWNHHSTRTNDKSCHRRGCTAGAMLPCSPMAEWPMAAMVPRTYTCTYMVRRRTEVIVRLPYYVHATNRQLISVGEDLAPQNCQFFC
jgi:hypothetical protein